MSAATAPPLGTVTADAIYTLDFIRVHLGLGQSAIREARRKGLPIKYVGRKGFVLGSDLIAFVRDTATDQH